MITRQELTDAEEAATISFEMSGKVLRLLREYERLTDILRKVDKMRFVTAINVGKDELGNDGYNAIIQIDDETLAYIPEGERISVVLTGDRCKNLLEGQP